MVNIQLATVPQWCGIYILTIPLNLTRAEESSKDGRKYMLVDGNSS